MKDRLIWQDRAKDALLMSSKEQEDMQGWISFFSKTLIYEFHPPLLLSYCQHPHSPPADSPCGIDPGATWRGRHVSGSRYFPGPGWQVILIISWSTLAWKLLSSIVCNSILDLWMVLYKTATSSYFQNLAFLFTCWWWQAVLQCLETFRELPHLKTIMHVQRVKWGWGGIGCDNKR